MAYLHSFTIQKTTKCINIHIYIFIFKDIYWYIIYTYQSHGSHGMLIEGWFWPFTYSPEWLNPRNSNFCVAWSRGVMCCPKRATGHLTKGLGRLIKGEQNLSKLKYTQLSSQGVFWQILILCASLGLVIIFESLWQKIPMIHQIGIHSLCKFGARSIKARGSLGSYDTTKNVICKGCSGGFCPLEMENPNEPTNAGFDGNEVAAQAKLESKHGLIVDQRRFVHLIYRYWSFCLKCEIQYLLLVFQMISDMRWSPGCWLVTTRILKHF